jgi:uncharacterized protein YutE (UPF0331/DUF86 family)
MTTIKQKSEITTTFETVRAMSYTEKKKNYFDEEKINSFLDGIIDFKNLLKEKTNKIYTINQKIEEITWFDDLNDECLMILNDIISASKDLRSSLVRQYVSMNFLREKGIAKEEIKDFKNAIDYLKESYEDLETVFFFLPSMPDFVETTKQLSLV